MNIRMESYSSKDDLGSNKIVEGGTLESGTKSIDK